jgi:hypothetical protein
MLFACCACQLVLADRVDYSWCPKCGGPVDWVDRREPLWVCASCEVLVTAGGQCGCGRLLKRLLVPAVAAGPTVPPPISFATARRIFIGFAMVWLALALPARAHEPWVQVLLFAARIAGVACIAVIASSSAAIRELARDRKTRILHGLEHATIKLLERRDLEVRSGCTFDGFFVLDVEHDGRWWERLDEVRDAATEAIARIRAGEHKLAYDRRCGTSLLVAGLVVAVAITAVWIAALVLGWPDEIVMSATIGALGIAMLSARTLGLAAQRVLTVSTELASARVIEVTRRALADASGLELTVAIDVVPRARGGAEAVAPLGG